MTNENQNLLLAIGLSILVLIGWNYFYGQPKLDQARQQQQAQVQAQQGQPPVAQPAQQAAPVPGAAPQPGAAPGASPAPAQPAAPSPRISIDTPALKGSIALRGGLVDDLSLKGYRQTIQPGSPNVVLLSPLGSANPYFAEFGFVQQDGTAVPARDAMWTADRQILTASEPVTLTHDAGNGLVFRRTIAVDDRFMFTVKDKVENAGANAASLVPYALVRRFGKPPVEGYIILHEGPIAYVGDRLYEEGYEKVDKAAGSAMKWNGTGGWVGITDKYWATALIPDQKAPFDARFSSFNSALGPAGAAPQRVYQSDVTGQAITVAPGASAEVSTRLFAGAKEVNVINAYESQGGITQFSNMIDWGYFYFITRPLFQLIHFIYELVGNFGVAILAVTLIIKIIFFPLANKAYVSMAKMKAVQPEMTAIRERFAEDKQKQQQELMALYKREKINPVAGCLPIVIQIPVFFALYKVIFITIEMRHAPFFGWIRDLSAPDPTNLFTLFGLIPWHPERIPLFGPFLLLGIWPILMGVTMFIQMKMNPDPPDPVQKKLFTWMPVLFTFMLGAFPAGLVIYWTWNNLLSVLQQGYIMRRQGVKIELWDNLAGMFRKKAPAAK